MDGSLGRVVMERKLFQNLKGRRNAFKHTFSARGMIIKARNRVIRFVFLARLAASAVVNTSNIFKISGVNQVMKKKRQCESIHSDGRNGVQHSGT